MIDSRFRDDFGWRRVDIGFPEMDLFWLIESYWERNADWRGRWRCLGGLNNGSPPQILFVFDDDAAATPRSLSEMAIGADRERISTFNSSRPYPASRIYSLLRLSAFLISPGAFLA